MQQHDAWTSAGACPTPPPQKRSASPKRLSNGGVGGRGGQNPLPRRPIFRPYSLDCPPAQRGVTTNRFSSGAYSIDSPRACVERIYSAVRSKHSPCNLESEEFVTDHAPALIYDEQMRRIAARKQ